MEVLKEFGIVVCTRLKSSRIPNKCATNVNGKPLIAHLGNRLIQSGIKVIFATPQEDSAFFKDEIYPQISPCFHDSFFHFTGSSKDPMKRMLEAGIAHNLSHVIRVTHDKVFVDPEDIKKAMKEYLEADAEYLYSSTFTDGCGFEIISMNALRRACERFENVEHISYAIKAVTDKVVNYDNKKKWHPYVRLLVDFPEDLDLMHLIFACLGNSCTQQQVFEFLENNIWTRELNKKPIVTVYTCALNAEKWIEECMESVSMQKYFCDAEYLLIDDYSTDKTPYLMAKFASKHPNVRYIRNPENIGLASSSNVALSNARGRYIVRLDADDYFLEDSSLVELIASIEKKQKDVIYPNFYEGNRSTKRVGRKFHHVGGAIFRTRAINHIKFTEGLRGYDSLDIWAKAKDVLEIGYSSEIVFMYRQHADSMSKTNLEQRAIIKKGLEEKHGLTCNT